MYFLWEGPTFGPDGLLLVLFGPKLQEMYSVGLDTTFGTNGTRKPTSSIGLYCIAKHFLDLVFLSNASYCWLCYASVPLFQQISFWYASGPPKRTIWYQFCHGNGQGWTIITQSMSNVFPMGGTYFWPWWTPFGTHWPKTTRNVLSGSRYNIWYQWYQKTNSLCCPVL